MPRLHAVFVAGAFLLAVISPGFVAAQDLGPACDITHGCPAFPPNAVRHGGGPLAAITPTASQVSPVPESVPAAFPPLPTDAGGPDADRSQRPEANPPSSSRTVAFASTRSDAVATLNSRLSRIARLLLLALGLMFVGLMFLVLNPSSRRLPRLVGLFSGRRSPASVPSVDAPPLAPPPTQSSHGLTPWSQLVLACDGDINLAFVSIQAAAEQRPECHRASDELLLLAAALRFSQSQMRSSG